MNRRIKFLFSASLFVCFAFYAWLVLFSLSPRLPLPNEPPILYSNQKQKDLRLTFLRAIDSANKSIHLVMFGLTDPEVLRRLKIKSEENVSTQIYYDPSASPNLTIIPHLNARPIRGEGLMHQKILVVDEAMIFLGSANMTKSSLGMHDNLLIGLYSPKLARFIIEKTPFDSGNMKTMVGGQQVELWLLPDAHNALNSVKNLIKKARRSIHVAMFTLTHPVLIDELILASRRGVDVTVAIDFHVAVGASAKAIEKLKRSNIKILHGGGLKLFHHKFLYVDQKTLLIGSANWTKSAFNKNHDCFLIISNLAPDQKKFLNSLWSTIESESRTVYK